MSAQFTKWYLIIDGLAAIQNNPEVFAREAFGERATSIKREVQEAPMLHKLRQLDYNPIKFYKSLDLAGQLAMESWLEARFDKVKHLVI